MFQDFSTPYGLQPTTGWHGTAGSGFDPMHGPGSNCGVTGFTTHVKDCETGLQYMQARYYDPVSARFTSVDPVTFMDDGRTGMVGRYSYTLGDPVNNWDPDGENPLAIGAAVGYVVNKARSGAVKGAAFGVGTSYLTQAFDKQPGVNHGRAAISGAKGAVVGATQEVVGSPSLTAGVAGVAGFIDGAATSLADGGSISDALENGVRIGGQDAAFAYIGAKAGDVAGAGIAVGASTAVEYSPELRGAASDMIRDGISQVREVGETISNNLKKVATFGSEEDEYDEFSED